MALFFLMASLPFSHAASAQEARAEILQQQLNIRKEMRQSRNSPSRLSSLRAELLELRQALKDLRRKQALERREQRALRRKRLQPVSLTPVPLETSKEVLSAFEAGKASYYADMFNGRTTASGEIFSNSLMTAAHKTLPFGTRVRVRNPNNGNTIEVIINDRGPYVSGRIIDLTSFGFSQLDSISKGVIDVEIEVID